MREVVERALRLLRAGRLPDFRTHYRRLVKAYQHRPWRSFNMISLVSVHPPVILTGTHPDFLVRYLQPRLAGLKLTIFYRAGWSMEHEPSFRDRVESITRAQEKFPNHTYIFAANTPHEVELMTAAGIRAEFLSENAFIDEFSFQPAADGPKKYDAVLDAQVAPYKRLELATQIPRLAVVTFILPERFDASYSDLVRRSLAHAHWANGPYWGDSYRKLNRAQMCEVYRESRVGLCFSALEGANLASIQYLLCGLSVVSTPSQGGRDVFFSDEYATAVPAEPAAVAAAVARFVAHALPPAVVRQKTLAKIWPIRQHFAKILCAELGHPELTETWWRDFNTNNAIRYQDLRKIAAMLAEGHGLR